MKRTNAHNKLHVYLAILIAFSLPFGKLTPVFIVLLFANWLLEGNLKNKLNLFFKNRLALLFVLFYLIHIVGLFYTKNMNAGLFDIQVKLSILIFPIVLSSKPLNSPNSYSIFIAFLLGLVGASLYMLTRSGYIYTTTGEEHFFYQAFSVLIHPSYLSMYMNIAITWLWLLIHKRDGASSILPSALSILLIVFFSGIIIMLSSKSGIIVLCLLLVFFILHLVIIRKKYFVGVVGVLGMALSLFIIYQSAPKVVERMEEFSRTLFAKDTPQNQFESTSIRLRVWESASAIVKNNFFWGVGTGDAKDELLKEYKRRGLEYIYQSNLNAHNAFLQVFVSLGLIGFLILLANILFPIIYAFKTKHYAYLFFLLIIALNFCFESMLETQAGTMFYAYFNSLFCFEIFRSQTNHS